MFPEESDGQVVDWENLSSGKGCRLKNVVVWKMLWFGRKSSFEKCCRLGEVVVWESCSSNVVVWEEGDLFLSGRGDLDVALDLLVLVMSPTHEG